MQSAVDSWSTLPELKLRPDVDILTAADGRPLLRASNGRFVVLSSSSMPLVGLLEGGLSGAELALAIGFPSDASAGGRGQDALVAFLGVLDRAGMLTISDPRGQAKRGFFAGMSVDFMKRFPFRRIVADRAFDPLAGALHRLPARVLAAALWTVFACSIVLTATILTSAHVHPDLSATFFAALLALAALPLHESCHALAMRYWRIHIREVGVGLISFIAPVAYVDRTETYALRSRWGRVTIAVVGPACDALMALLFAVLSRVADGSLSNVLLVASALQFGIMCANLNPLLRGDGYHAIEAAFGRLNVRAHAFEYVTRSVLVRQQPAHLRGLSGPVRVGYFVYVVIGFGYMLFFLGLLVFAVVSVLEATL